MNKFVWSALAWDSRQTVTDVLRDFAHYFIGTPQAEGFAQGLMHLERNWQGPLATNSHVDVTLERFPGHGTELFAGRHGELEISAGSLSCLFRRLRSPALAGRNGTCRTGKRPAGDDAGYRLGRCAIGNWRCTCHLAAQRPSPGAPAGQSADDPGRNDHPADSGELRTRIMELAAALFQSIRMQLAVERYQGEAVERAANLDTLDTPVSNAMWVRAQILDIQKTNDPMAQIAAIRSLLFRTDPGPGGFYDQLGNVSSRPHLELGPGSVQDPEFRNSPFIGFRYPDPFHGGAPIAWKCWAGSLFDAPLTMRYSNLDPKTPYRLRVVHSGDAPHMKLRLVANDTIEIHPYVLRAWPPAPQEFSIPATATAGGELKLAWTREPGLGGNGRGCQVAEVWLIPTPTTEPS